MCQKGEFLAMEVFLGDAQNQSKANRAVKCNKCPVGFHQNKLGAASCLECSAGRFMNTTGSHECQKCSEGKFTKSSQQTECIFCAPGRGTIPETTGNNFCPPCAKGRFSSLVTEGLCLDCPINYFQPNEQMSTCNKCSPRMEAIREGQATCTKRVGDKLKQPTDLKLEIISSDNSAIRLRWKYDMTLAGVKGQFSAPDWFDVRIGHDRQFVTGLGLLKFPEQRVMGKNSRNVEIRFSRLSCKFVDGLNANEENLNSGACMCGTKLCRLRSPHKENYCQRKTSHCSTTQIQRQIAPRKLSNLSIEYFENYSWHTLWLQSQPTYISIRAHKDLPEVNSTWSESTEAWPLAASCGDEEFLDTSSKENTPTDWKCRLCPTGAACRGPTVWSDVRAKWGWWRVPWKSDVFISCPFENDCKGYRSSNLDKTFLTETGNTSTASYDNAFRMKDVDEGCVKGTQGVLCNSCSSGYIREGFTCVKCSKDGFGLRVAIVISIAMILALLVNFCKRRLKIGKWKRYSVLWRDVIRIFSINVTFAQISSSLSSVIDIDWPPNFLLFIKNLNFVNVDFMSLIGASCVGDFSFITSFLCMTALPLIVILFAFAEYRFEKRGLRLRLSNMSGAERVIQEKNALHLLFKIADSDNSGHIDPSETKNILSQLGWRHISLEISVKLMETVGASLNDHGSYTLSESEFVSSMVSGVLTNNLAKLLQEKRNQRKRKREQDWSRRKANIRQKSHLSRMRSQAEKFEARKIMIKQLNSEPDIENAAIKSKDKQNDHTKNMTSSGIEKTDNFLPQVVDHELPNNKLVSEYPKTSMMPPNLSPKTRKTKLALRNANPPRRISVSVPQTSKESPKKAKLKRKKNNRLFNADKLVRWTLERHLISNAMSAATQLLLLAHTPVSRKVFQYFHCHDVAGRYFLRADYGLECWSTRWWAFLPVVLSVLALFTIALPSVIAWYLFVHRKELYSTSVYQTLGWLYDPYNRGSEGWQIHDVLLKMILTGMLIYIPTMARASVAIIICMIAVANLNYFSPHKNRVLFWLTQLSFLVTATKYVTTLMLGVGNEGLGDAGRKAIGTMLISLDLFFMISSFISIFLAVWLLQQKVKSVNSEAMEEKKWIASRSPHVAKPQRKHQMKGNKGHGGSTKVTVVPMALADNSDDDDGLALSSNSGSEEETTFVDLARTALTSANLPLYPSQKNKSRSESETDNQGRDSVPNMPPKQDLPLFPSPQSAHERDSSTKGERRTSTARAVDELLSSFDTHSQMLRKTHSMRQQKQKRQTQMRLKARMRVKQTKTLSYVPLFSDCSPDAINKIVDAMEYRRFEPGTDLCRQGELADRFYVIVSGQCAVSVAKEGVVASAKSRLNAKDEPHESEGSVKPSLAFKTYSKSNVTKVKPEEGADSGAEPSSLNVLSSVEATRRDSIANRLKFLTKKVTPKPASFATEKEKKGLKMIRVGTLKDLDVFGESALLPSNVQGKKMRAATVTAEGSVPVQVLSISSGAFSHLVTSGVLDGTEILDMLTEESRKRNAMNKMASSRIQNDNGFITVKCDVCETWRHVEEVIDGRFVCADIGEHCVTGIML